MSKTTFDELVEEVKALRRHKEPKENLCVLRASFASFVVKF